MSGSVTSTRPGLGSGLARCQVPTAADGQPPAALTTTGSDYSAPAISATQRALPVRPLPPASVMHRCRELRFPPISHSHYIHAASKSTADSAKLTAVTVDVDVKVDGGTCQTPPSTNRRNETHLHVSADRRLETCSTTTGETFQPTPRTVLPAILVRKPAADRSKFTHYCSADDWSRTCSTVRPHHSVSDGRSGQLREKYVVTRNAGCCPITGSSGEIKAQRRDEDALTTTNRMTYRRHAVRAADKNCVRHHPSLSNIPLGDICKAELPVTTSRATYQHPKPTSPDTHYSRSAAVAATLHSSVHFGGTTDKMSTATLSPTVKERVPRPATDEEEERGESRRAERVYRNASFLPQGDMDAERVRERMSHSTTKNTHQVPPLNSYPAHVDSTRLHTASSVHLGHHCHHPLSSTMTTSYRPLTAHSHRVAPPHRDNIPFDYYPGHLSDSTAASSYRSHIGDLRHNLPPNTLKNLKTSHWQLSSTLS